MHQSQKNLANLRSSMKNNSIDAYIIPNTDPHLSEYVPDHWRTITWLTGFTGSSAIVVVTDSFAGLWTDPRYFIQAENQLQDSGFICMKPVLGNKKDFIDWINDTVAAGSKIAFDGKTFSIGLMRKMENILEGKNVSYNIESDLISGIWTDRPAMPLSIAFDLPVSFCGKERVIKIAEVREKMRKQNIDFHLLTSIDDIMWLLNIRGNDAKYSPLLISFAIVGKEQILFFVDKREIPFKLVSEFDRLNIFISPYEETAGVLTTLSTDATILINPETISTRLFNSIPAGMKIVEDVSIPCQLKAVKNKVEIENIGKAMVKDGIALTKFFFWLEENPDLAILTELSLAEKLNGLRSEQADFLGPSFSTIVAYNEHGALPHYSATSENDSAIGSDGILLIDSGGQYLNGTTDITRTIALGRPTAKQIMDFTLVLKGVINLALSNFPSGTSGIQLDILARKALWENGLNYGHGTGHGVGFCLNVHEGPLSISPVESTGSRVSIEPGMLISDEPAIYREGEYGIRIENLILCYEDEESEFGQFLKFDTVSLCYIDKTLIDILLLDQKEIDWLNAYHTKVYEKLTPFLTEDEKSWLKEKTKTI